MAARYHIGMPIQVALTLMEQGDKMYTPDVNYHQARAQKLLAKGAKHYSVCPQVRADGLCGCTPPPVRPVISLPYGKQNRTH